MCTTPAAPRGRWLRRFAPALAVMLAAGCSAAGPGANSATTSATPASSGAPSVTTGASASAGAGGSPSATAPPPGTRLATLAGAGQITPISQGSGFAAVLNTFVNGSDQSLVTTYDPGGRVLATVPAGSLTGACGALDVVVPGVGRTILTERVITTPAAGLTAASYAATLDAWDATTGRRRWSAAVAPPSAQSLVCQTPDSSKDTGGGLMNFATTADGRWGLVTSPWAVVPVTGPSQAVDLATGATRPEPTGHAALGSYLVRWTVAHTGDFPTRFELVHPADGAPAGVITTDPQGSNGGILALPASVPPGRAVDDYTVLSSDGQRLLVRDHGQGPSTKQLRAIGLPGGQTVWTSPPLSEPTVRADAGGVVVVTEPSTAARGPALVGYDDATGAVLWTLPDATVCGVTAHQALLALNGQLATIDLRSGRQISSTTGFCPVLLPGGQSVDHGVVTQVLTP